MDEKKHMVTIPLEDYQELIDSEKRLSAIEDEQDDKRSHGTKLIMAHMKLIVESLHHQKVILQDFNVLKEPESASASINNLEGVVYIKFKY